MRVRLTLLLLPFLATLANPAFAADPPEFPLAFLGDRFEPTEIQIPANTKVTLKVENRSSGAMEFESKSMHREKVIPAGGKASISIGPLKPGRYDFIDDFHPKIGGVVVAR